MTLLAQPPTSAPIPECPYLERALIEARERIQVKRIELDEARSRRQRIINALRREFGGRCYVNGSVAHGDALTPLTDIDLGVVVPNDDGVYGPGRRGPADLQQRAADAIRRELGGDFPNLRITWIGQRRAVFVQFGDPVTPGQKDFTADVITAIDYVGGNGLHIPDNDGWSRSDPEAHTRMISERNDATHASFARVMRLIKHWARRNGKPLCSWNIKALGLEALTRETGMLDGMRMWFDHAIDSLSEGPTDDPAHVAGPIGLPDGWSIGEVVRELQEAARKLRRAIRFEQEGYPALALDELAKLFRDPQMMPGPTSADLQSDIKRREANLAPTAAILPTTVSSNALPLKPRSWGRG